MFFVALSQIISIGKCMSFIQKHWIAGVLKINNIPSLVGNEARFPKPVSNCWVVLETKSEIFFPPRPREVVFWGVVLTLNSPNTSIIKANAIITSQRLLCANTVFTTSALCVLFNIFNDLPCNIMTSHLLNCKTWTGIDFQH